MGRCLRSCIQSVLKFVNSVIGMVGMAMILYSLWMIKAWHSHLDSSSMAFSAPTVVPWFIYTFLGLGISLCLITCSGHIAAETANAHCLSCYMLFVFLLVLLEAGITADVFFNSNWEEDFPEDATGGFDEFKVFVRSNYEMCKWISLVIVGAQALSILLAMVLRAFGPDLGRDYDSEDDNIPARLPLLRNSPQHPPFAGDPHLVSKNDAWKIHDKISR